MRVQCRWRFPSAPPLHHCRQVFCSGRLKSHVSSDEGGEKTTCAVVRAALRALSILGRPLSSGFQRVATRHERRTRGGRGGPEKVEFAVPGTGERTTTRQVYIHRTDECEPGFSSDVIGVPGKGWRGSWLQSPIECGPRWTVPGQDTGLSVLWIPHTERYTGRREPR